MTEAANFLQIFQTIGAVIGVATGFFVIYDRIVRQTPTMFVLPRGLIADDGEQYPHLLVTNHSSSPILVSWENGSHDNSLRVSKNDSIRAILDTVLEGKTTVVVKPDQTEIFPVLLPNNYDSIDGKNHVDLSIWWQFAQYRIPQVRWRRRIVFKKENLEHLLNREA